MKTSELTGAALDWAVAKCEGLSLHKDAMLDSVMMEGWYASGYYMDPNQWIRLGKLRYSTDWSQGGPIIEREKIAVWFHSDYSCWCAAGIEWMDADVDSEAFLAMPDAFRGPTPLIAAMRCYVASKLGNEVEIPEELL